MYTKEQIKLFNGESISTQTLNKKIYKLHDNLVNTTFVTTSAQSATTELSGVIEFTSSFATSSENLKAVSPFTLNNTPIFLNSFFNNDISDTVQYNNTSMNYVELMNNVLLVFGKINTGSNNFTINLKNLFQLTPYSISRILYINIGGNQNRNTISPCTVINSITDTSVNVNSLNFNLPKVQGLDVVVEWFMLAEVIKI